MTYRITVLPGDGIGPEVTREALRILRAVGELCGYEFVFNEQRIGAAAIRETREEVGLRLDRAPYLGSLETMPVSSAGKPSCAKARVNDIRT